MGKTTDDGIKIIATNRRAHHEFFIEDTYEAGLQLQGTEVKSLREGHCSIAEAYAKPRGEELYLFDMHVPPYDPASVFNHEPTRPRKLLLHRREIGRITAQCTQRGYTLIPTRLYWRGGYAKVELGLARRKRQHDKREQMEVRQRREDLRRELPRR